MKFEHSNWTERENNADNALPFKASFESVLPGNFDMFAFAQVRLHTPCPLNKNVCPQELQFEI